MSEQVLVAKRSMVVCSMRYPTGSMLPASDISPRNLQAMIDSRAARWESKSSRVYPAPLDLPPAAPEHERPEVEIVHDLDVVLAWKKTKAAMAEKLGGNSALAEDLILATAEGRDLFKRATQTSCQAEAKRRNTWSVPPNEARL